MEQLEYITQKAIMQCSCGGAPGIFNPTYNTTVKINGCLVATEIDKAPLTNIPSFIVCKTTQKPCVPASTMWQNTYPVKIKGQQALIGGSCMMCSIGGKIEFLSSGQIPLDPEEENEINEIREDVQKSFEKEQEEKNKPWWQKVGEFALDMVPVVGPVVSLVKNVAEGNWGMAVMDVGFLALDITGLAAAPFSGGSSVAAATAAKAGIRAAVKAGAKSIAKKVLKEAIQTAAKKTCETLSKLTVRNLTRGKLCVFACFPAGTPVSTKDGLKNIEDIEVGDEVWSYDETTGEIGLKPVLNTFEKTVDLLVKIEIDGEVITATPEHPFYANGEWKEAGLLETGDSILLFSGRLAKVGDVKYEGKSAPMETDSDKIIEPEVVYKSKTKVFNLEVEGWHTYFIGCLQFLVHNAGGICLKQIIKEIKEGKKKLREILLGRTPSKSLKTGKEVIERMEKEGKILRDKKGNPTHFKSEKDKEWYPIELADMSHKEDCVKWWNRNRRKHRARSKKVRNWMKDSENYYLEHHKYNRSDGAKSGKRNRYKLPRR